MGAFVECLRIKIVNTIKMMVKSKNVDNTIPE